MKKIIVLVLVSGLIFLLAACGGGNSDPIIPTIPTVTPERTPDPNEIEGEFFPGISDEDIPDILRRKAGVVESAVKVASDDPDFSYEVFIVLAEVPMNFYSILSHHYQMGSTEYDVPLDESLNRTFSFDWGYIEMSNKDLIINDQKIEIHAVMY